MRRTLFLWLAVVFSISVHAQTSQTITGTVTDPDHAAVPAASVRLFSRDGSHLAHTLTNQQGQFSFQQPCNACSVEIQLTGFVTQRVRASRGWFTSLTLDWTTKAMNSSNWKWPPTRERSAVSLLILSTARENLQ